MVFTKALRQNRYHKLGGREKRWDMRTQTRIQGGRAVINYYGNTRSAVKALFPEIGWDETKFKIYGILTKKKNEVKI